MSPTAGSWVGGSSAPAASRALPACVCIPGRAPSSLDRPQVPARRPGARTGHPALPQEGTRPPSPMRPPKTSAQDVSSETLLGPWVLDDTGVVLSPRFPGTRMCGFQSCVLPSSQKPGALCQPRGVGGTLVVSGVSAAGTRDPLTGAHVGAPGLLRGVRALSPAHHQALGDAAAASAWKTGAGRSPSVPGRSPAALGESLGSVCSSPHRVY